MTTFSGPLKVKVPYVDTPVGTVEVVQRVTITPSNSAGGPAQLVLPSGCDITDVMIDVETPFATAAGVTACNLDVQLASAANLIGRIVVSASGRYALVDALSGVGNVAKLRNVTETTLQAFVSVQSLATALSAGQGILTARYVMN